MNDELRNLIHQVDKKTASYHAANDVRWETTGKVLSELSSDMKEVKNAVVGLKVKIAGFVAGCTVVAYVGVEVVKMLMGGG